MIFPLGNAFSLPSSPEVLLVGGGCGVAPLLFLAQFLARQHVVPKILLGFRTKEEMFETENYSRYGELLITTDDGSYGSKGLVVDHPVFQTEHFQEMVVFYVPVEKNLKQSDRVDYYC